MMWIRDIKLDRGTPFAEAIPPKSMGFASKIGHEADSLEVKAPWLSIRTSIRNNMSLEATTRRMLHERK